MNNKLISCKGFIGELMEDMNLDIIDYVDTVYRWIESAIEQVGAIKSFPLQYEVLEVKDWKTELPCNIKWFHSAWTKCWENCNQGIGYLNVVDSPFMANRELMGRYNGTGNMARIDGSSLNVEFEKGHVLIIYRSIPRDSEGLPMIIDNAFLKEALGYYIIYRMILKGIKHPTLSFETALQLWNTMYPRASNDIDWFTLPELEEFTRMFSIILSGKITDNLYTY